MKQTRLRSLFSSAVLVAVLVFVTIPASAQTRTGSGLQISPPRHELSVEPGAQKAITISLKNVSGVDITAKAQLHDFETDNETGTPKLNTDPSIKSGSSIRPFLSKVEDVELSKDGTKDIAFTIAVPKNTPAGAYYGFIKYQAVPKAAPGAEPNSVALTASVGSIILLEVPGNVTESMRLVSIKPARDKQGGKVFTKPPNKVAVEVENTGNSFLKPFGKVILTKGGKDVYSYEVNNTEPRGNVLPKSYRTFRDDLKNVTGFGKYTVTASLGYGKGGEVITSQTSFWYVPQWLLAAGAVTLLLLLLLGYWIYYKSKHTGKVLKK